MSISAILYNKKIFKAATNKIPIEIEGIDLSASKLFFLLATAYGQTPSVSKTGITINYDSNTRVSSGEIVLATADLASVAKGKYVYNIGYSETNNLATSKILLSYGEVEVLEAINNPS